MNFTYQDRLNALAQIVIEASEPALRDPDQGLLP